MRLTIVGVRCGVGCGTGEQSRTGPALVEAPPGLSSRGGPVLDQSSPRLLSPPPLSLPFPLPRTPWWEKGRTNNRANLHPPVPSLRLLPPPRGGGAPQDVAERAPQQGYLAASPYLSLSRARSLSASVSLSISLFYVYASLSLSLSLSISRSLPSPRRAISSPSPRRGGPVPEEVLPEAGSS